LHFGSVFQVLGITFLLLCSGRLAQGRFGEHEKWYLNDAFFIICTLIGLAGIGMLMALVSGLGFVSWIISLSGYGLFAHFLFKYFPQQEKKENLIIIGISISFAIWVASIFWGYGVYSPLYFESFAIELPHVDTLFHIAMAEMIKTYGVPSVGIEGITYFPYHFGSHFLFVQLSHLLRMDMIIFYPMAFPIIFLSLFFKIFLQFIYTISNKTNSLKITEPKYAILFWLVFFWGFIGLVDFNYLNRAGAATYAVLLSESYTLSLIILFVLLDLCFRFWKSYCAGSETLSEKIIFSLILAPFLFAFIGLVKISTLYIALSLAGYTFLRLKLFRNAVFTFSILVTVILSACILLSTHQFNKGQGEIDFFHYLEAYIDVPLIVFFILFYWWVLALAFIVIYKFRHKKEVQSGKLNFYALELALTASVMGFLPAAFLKLHGGSANYFMEPQIWLALAFTLSCLGSVNDLMVFNNSKRKVLTLVLFLACLFFIGQNFKHHFKLLGYKNLSLRKYMVDKSANLMIPRRRLLQATFHSGKTTRDNFRAILYQPQLSINDDVEFIFFKRLHELNKREDRLSTFVFIENKHGLHSAFSCNAIPFVIPVLTGMATLHGIPYDYCPATDYGFDQYPLEPRTEIGRINKPAELCAEIEKAGKKKLIILNYNNFTIDSVQSFHCEMFSAINDLREKNGINKSKQTGNANFKVEDSYTMLPTCSPIQGDCLQTSKSKKEHNIHHRALLLQP
ncbi:MAG: hypothetical protein ABIR06_15885, partial [Cyclobacteriaceae bacterium]